MHTTNETNEKTIGRIRRAIEWTQADCPSCGGCGGHNNPDQEEAARGITHSTCYGCGGDGFVMIPEGEIKMSLDEFFALCAEMSHLKSDLDRAENKTRRLEARLEKSRAKLREARKVVNSMTTRALGCVAYK